MKKFLLPVTRIEGSIRLFLAMLLLWDFLVYQLDVAEKGIFIWKTIDEEVYVTQHGFKDMDIQTRVYKVWKMDQTLFIKKQKGDILLVQVYVDDIIFGSTNKELCTAFEKLMNAENLKKFNYTDVKSASTPINLEKPLVKDLLDYLGSEEANYGCSPSQLKLNMWMLLVLYDKYSRCQNSIIGLWVVDEAVHKELGDIMERAATTTSSLEAEHDSGNINKTQSMATLNGSSP
ncbi:putative ribonuclease H-like domain-containing protein [Tanacetum coccineum]|uniref:Ribonuclease H-like domain-containing protein n=1 Tax=Tanacetum coccineum TaxID=301880 RepID=A0ABQ4WP48_9ASTR